MPNVSLTPQLEAFLERQVAAGRYATMSEAVRAGVALLEQQVHEDELRLEALRFRLEQARRSIERGDATVLDDRTDREVFLDEILAEVEAES